MAVPYTFATQTTSIPLAQLDTNFSTPITIGTTVIPLGNVAPILENVILGNVVIATGNVTLTNISVINATITKATITTANVATANITIAYITTANIATANVTAMEAVSGNVTTLRSTTINVTTANVTTLIATGNVGIGTASPSVRLDVRTAAAGAAIQWSDNVNSTGFLSTVTGASAINSNTTLVFGTGASSTEHMRIATDGNVAIGTATTTGAKFIVNANTALPATAPLAGTSLWVTGADAATNRITLDGFGASGNFTFRTSNGTAAAPTATLANGILGTIAAFGYGATAYPSTSRSSMVFYAAENWTDTAQGTYQTFLTTAIGATTNTERMRIDSSGNLLLGSTSATGTGALRGSYGTGGITTCFAAGDGALNANTTGSQNTAVGYNALTANTIGTTNTAVGFQALATNTTGISNSAMGREALFSNLTGQYNSAMGLQALYYNTASNNTAVGFQAMYGASGTSTGTGNSALGYQALYSNTTGANNSAMGQAALQFNTTGNNNSAMGQQALYYNTASNNTAVGFQAMQGASGTSTGASNSALGYQALYANTSGINNAAMGQAALQSNTTGSYNSAFGLQALNANTTGTNNTALGYAAGTSTTGSYNTIVGGYQGALTPIMTSGTNWTVLSDGQANVKLAIDTNSAIWAVNGQPFFNSPTPTAKTAAATLTGAELLTGIITYNGLAASLTMPLGSALDTAITATNMPVDRAFEFVVINLGATTATMAVNTGVTFVGTLTVLTLTSVRWRVRKTAASTFIVYRVSN